MMIGVSGADKLEKQLSDFSLVFKRKLENMVENFAVEIAEKASQETPIGNQADIDKGSGRYWSFYKERLKLGLPMEVGYHKGAWDFSTTSNFPFIKRIRSVVEMLNDVRGESESVVLGAATTRPLCIHDPWKLRVFQAALRCNRGKERARWSRLR